MEVFEPGFNYSLEEVVLKGWMPPKVNPHVMED